MNLRDTLPPRIPPLINPATIWGLGTAWRELLEGKRKRETERKEERETHTGRQSETGRETESALPPLPHTQQGAAGPWAKAPILR